VSKGVADRRRVAKPEVLFVHEGYASIEWDDKVLMLGVGDTITVPIGLERTVSGEAAIYRVSG
jgi:mannose-6-phosphate isomerase-like protein (cupin superfamily)